MANCSRNRCRSVTAAAAATMPPLAGVAAADPPVRRWPHPIPSAVSSQQADPAFQYIRCALSCQNELLSQIRDLLEQLVSQETGCSGKSV